MLVYWTGVFQPQMTTLTSGNECPDILRGRPFGSALLGQRELRKLTKAKWHPEKSLKKTGLRRTRTDRILHVVQNDDVGVDKKVEIRHFGLNGNDFEKHRRAIGLACSTANDNADLLE